jgi:Tfp pilus assembly protein PilF
MDLDGAQLARLAFDAGVRLQAQGDAAGARRSFGQALAAQPDMAPAWSNLGLLHEDDGRPDEAEACYRRALALHPDLHAAVMNLATLLAQQMRFDEAEQCYRQAIALEPGDPAPWSNLGAMLTCLRREGDAQACLRHALNLDPNYDKARFNLGYLWMRQGRLQEGWLCNEARPFPATLQARLGIARWSGEPLRGRSVLLATDAAHGDLIQMVRYARVLKAKGAARVAVWGQPALRSLLSRAPDVDCYIAFDEPFAPAEWDCWAPLMSLPHLCGTTVDDIPAVLPYLHAEPSRVGCRAKAMAEQGAHAGLRVGLVWRGNPRHENDAQRSLPSLRTLKPLWQVPGVHFVSLQSGAGSEQARRPPARQPLLSLHEPLGDFLETAAVVANLDLVIGVDTSVVHLAGALGKPVWVLLSDYKTDWRWMNGRVDSPWYPGVMRLFRQDASRQWAPVIAQVAQALGEWAAKAAPMAPVSAVA